MFAHIFSRHLSAAGCAAALAAVTLGAATTLVAAPSFAAAPYSVSGPSAVVASGGAASIVFSITAGEGFKANQKYGHSAKDITTTAGVTAPDKVTGSAAGSTITISVPVKADQSGTVSGTLRFSVCSDTKCVIEKQAFATTVTVK